VLLHPSKAEGFGMNVLETQMLGTPVVTTSFMAMADYTKWGVAVPPRQLSFMISALVAQPDVPGLVDALSATYLGGIEDNSKSARAWIEQKFSPKAVTEAFVNLIETTEAKLPMHEEAGSWFTLVNDDVPRLLDWETPWTLLANKNVEFNQQAINMLFEKS